MTELKVRPLQFPAKGRILTELDPALLRIAMLRYRDHLTRGAGVFHVGIPPHPDSPEAKDWTWRRMV